MHCLKGRLIPHYKTLKKLWKSGAATSYCVERKFPPLTPILLDGIIWWAARSHEGHHAEYNKLTATATAPHCIFLWGTGRQEEQTQGKIARCGQVTYDSLIHQMEGKYALHCKFQLWPLYNPCKILNHHNHRLCEIFLTGVNLLLKNYSVLSQILFLVAFLHSFV